MPLNEEHKTAIIEVLEEAKKEEDIK
jgi:hypothetical protein